MKSKNEVEEVAGRQQSEFYKSFFSSLTNDKTDVKADDAAPNTCK